MSQNPDPTFISYPAAEKICDTRYQAARARRESVLTNLADGMVLRQAWSSAGMSESAYKKARIQHRDWAARVDELTGAGRRVHKHFDGSFSQFFQTYFGHRMAWFHLLYLEELERLPPGNILMALFPPEHGKTTMYEDYASMKLALDGEWWRGIVLSASTSISRKIIRRVKGRMDPMGSNPGYVADFGPFEPQYGNGSKRSQPWGADYFDVFRKAESDERDYSLYAVGADSEIQSARTNHLHVDDPQSLKTLKMTDTIETKFRQEALSRTGEMGINTIALTRVGDDDFASRMEADEAMIDAGILKIIKFPAIITNPTTGKLEPLWAEKNTMEQMERIMIKSGGEESETWSSQYMLTPGAGAHGKRTFTVDVVERCNREGLSLMDRPTDDAVIYVTLDPALGSKNCVMALEVRPEGKLRLVKMRERVGLKNNDQIIDELAWMLYWCSNANVAAVIIESMNFQKGLAREERLLRMRDKRGFELREHETGSNKYDPNIGVPSMVGSFIRQDIELPHAPDTHTRFEMNEFRRQLYAWKPLERGSKLRQDRVMAFWFGWILWQSRRKTEVASTNTDQWRRQGITSWASTPGSSLVLPVGARP